MDFLIPAHSARPGDDPIFALNAEARARKAAGHPVVNATVGALLEDDGRLAVLPTVASVLREVPADVSSRYAPLAGTPEFLDGVVKDLLGDRPEAAWAVAAATPGGTGALRLAIANFLEPQQTLLTSSYYWGPYKTLAEEADRNLATFRMFAEDGSLDVDDFEGRLHKIVSSQGRALVFLNSPCHNPTGYSFDDGEWTRIVSALEREAARGAITVVIDVAYARYAAESLDSCLDRVLPLAGKALVTFAWSGSKSHTGYGYRVGALVAVHPDAEVRRRVQAALTFSCRGTWSNCNASGMTAVGRVLQDASLKAKVDAERQQLKALLDGRVARWNEHASAAGLRYPRYSGGFFTTVFCDDAFGVAEALKADGIFVVPQAGALRVAICSVAEADVPKLVERIAARTAR